MSDQTLHQEESLELLDALEIGFDLTEYNHSEDNADELR